MLATVFLSVTIIPGIAFLVWVFINLCKESRRSTRFQRVSLYEVSIPRNGAWPSHHPSSLKRPELGEVKHPVTIAVHRHPKPHTKELCVLGTTLDALLSDAKAMCEQS